MAVLSPQEGGDGFVDEGRMLSAGYAMRALWKSYIGSICRLRILRWGPHLELIDLLLDQALLIVGGRRETRVVFSAFSVLRGEIIFPRRILRTLKIKLLIFFLHVWGGIIFLSSIIFISLFLLNMRLFRVRGRTPANCAY